MPRFHFSFTLLAVFLSLVLETCYMNRADLITTAKGGKRLTHNRPKWSGIQLQRNWKDFSFSMRNFKLWKMPKLLNSRFLKGRYFLNCDDTELKRFSKINVSVCERHRWAVGG